MLIQTKMINMNVLHGINKTEKCYIVEQKF
jgi:hypothetical protein